nr:MAG TPA: hypothetical protein [Caudoviricetes sp.]
MLASFANAYYICSVLKILTGGKYRKNARQFND